jgi:hypothetical protein
MLLYRIRSAVGGTTTNCTVTLDGRGLVIVESESGSILFCEVPAP